LSIASNMALPTCSSVALAGTLPTVRAKAVRAANLDFMSIGNSYRMPIGRGPLNQGSQRGELHFRHVRSGKWDARVFWDRKIPACYRKRYFTRMLNRWRRGWYSWVGRTDKDFMRDPLIISASVPVAVQAIPSVNIGSQRQCADRSRVSEPSIPDRDYPYRIFCDQLTQVGVLSEIFGTFPAI
jgi:hypothetical protein